MIETYMDAHSKQTGGYSFEFSLAKNKRQTPHQCLIQAQLYLKERHWEIRNNWRDVDRGEVEKVIEASWELALRLGISLFFCLSYIFIGPEHLCFVFCFSDGRQVKSKGEVITDCRLLIIIRISSFN